MISSISRRWLFWLASAMVLTALYLIGQLIYQNLYSKKVIKNSESPAADAAPVQFDFYTVLPKMKVDSEVKSATAAASRYFLQIASVKQWEEAQRWREQLQNWGFTVVIQKNLNQQSVKYDVFVGPYPTLAAAQHAQEWLHSHRTEVIKRVEK